MPPACRAFPQLLAPPRPCGASRAPLKGRGTASAAPLPLRLTRTRGCSEPLAARLPPRRRVSGSPGPLPAHGSAIPPDRCSVCPPGWRAEAFPARGRRRPSPACSTQKRYGQPRLPGPAPPPRRARRWGGRCGSPFGRWAGGEAQLPASRGRAAPPRPGRRAALPFARPPRSANRAAPCWLCPASRSTVQDGAARAAGWPGGGPSHRYPARFRPPAARHRAGGGGRLGGSSAAPPL